MYSLPSKSTYEKELIISVVVTIKNQLKSKIQSCPSVQQVYTWEEMNPTGWPCVMLTIKSMNGEFSSNIENSRIYSYTALVLMDIGQDFETPKVLNRLDYAENTISTVIDEIITAVDNNFVLDGTPVLFAEAVDVNWGYTQGEFGVARSAEITLNIYTEIII